MNSSKRTSDWLIGKFGSMSGTSVEEITPTPVLWKLDYIWTTDRLEKTPVPRHWHSESIGTLLYT